MAQVRRRHGVRVLAAVGAANALVGGVSFGLAASGPALRDALDLTDARLGLLLAGIPLGLMLGTFAWGVLADRLGERRTLVLSYVLATTSLVVAAVLGSAVLVLGLGLALVAFGFTGGAAHSAGGRAIIEAYPAHMHGRALAIRHTFIPIGGAIGGVVLPWTITSFGLGAALAGGAALCALVVVGLGRGLPADDDRRATDVVAERAAIDAASDGERVAPTRGRSPLASPQLWLLGGSCSLFGLLQLTLMSFLTVHLVDEAGFGLATAATIFAAAQLIGAAARISMGAVSDRVGDPGIVLLWIAATAGALFLAAILAPVRVEGVLLAAVLVVLTSWNGVAVAAAARIAPRGRIGATLGMQTTMNATMGVVAPIAAGLTIQHVGWGPLLYGALAALAVAGVGIAAVRSSVARAPLGS